MKKTALAGPFGANSANARPSTLRTCRPSLAAVSAVAHNAAHKTSAGFLISHQPLTTNHQLVSMF
jgi:hypothetical protein